MNTTYSYHNIKEEFTYIILWLLLTACCWIAMKPLVLVSTTALLLNCSVFSALIVFTGWLWNLLPEKNYMELIVAPRTILNYVTLGIFVLALWAGLYLLVIYFLLLKEEFVLLLPLFPLHLFIAVLILIAYGVYDYLVSHKEDDAERLSNDDSEVVQEEDLDDIVLEQLAVKSGQKIQVILVDDIYALQADGDYVLIFTEKAKYLKEQTMKYFMAHLPDKQFVRIHRSCIINVKQVLRIELYKKQQQMITLKNGYEVKASVAGYKLLKEVLNL